jgi:hypothetical protein
VDDDLVDLAWTKKGVKKKSRREFCVIFLHFSLLCSKKKGKKMSKEEGNESGSDDDIAFADDDNDTNAQEEETNVESYDSEDENLQKEVRTRRRGRFFVFSFFFSLLV